MYWLKILGLNLLIFFLLSACQCLPNSNPRGHSLVVGDEESLTFAKRVSESQAQEDIEHLISALDAAYAGNKYFSEKFMAEKISKLRDISGAMSIEELHDRIDEILFEIPDNHLSAYYLGRVSKLRQSKERLGGVGKNQISAVERVWEVHTQKVGSKNILLICISSFPDSADEVWQGFTEAVRAGMGKADSIVLDLRGNNGGDDAKGMELAKILFGHDFEHPIRVQYRLQTPEAYALALNKEKVDIINRKSAGESIPTGLLARRDHFLQLLEQSRRGEFSPEQKRRNKGGGRREDPVTGYKKPIYILTDAGCGSSCEFTVAAFFWHPLAKLVGENTSGTFHFSNYGLAVLPNSKIKVTIPSQFNEFFDQRFIERQGLTPDIRVPHGQDAFEAVLGIIN